MAAIEAAIELINAAADRAIATTNLPGVALVVTDAGGVLGAVMRGYAHEAARRAVDETTRFPIASVSKSFAALCVLQEEARGTLALDVSVNRLVPWLELPEPSGPITLHDLLTHTAGLPAGVGEGYWGRIDAIRARSFPYTGGARRFWYSNVGYTIVGHVLEHVTGRPVHELIEERILRPLGMSRSSGALVEADRLDAAVGHEPIFSDRVAHPRSPLASAPWVVSNTADGSIIASAADLAAYARLVLARGEGLLTPDAFDRWTAPHVESDAPGERYGYGWDVVDEAGRRALRHTGGTVGYTSLIEVWPDEGLAVAVCQNGQCEPRSLGGIALAAIAAHRAGRPLPDLAARGKVPGTDVAGRYRSARRAVQVHVTAGAATIVDGDVVATLEPVGRSADTLVASHPALDRFLFQVERGPDGEVAGLAHGPEWLVRDGASEPDEPAAPPAWTSCSGLYRTEVSWIRAIRVYERRGRLYLLHPLEAEEHELIALADGSFAIGDAALPARAWFLDEVEGRPETLEYNGCRLSRSFERQG